MTKLYTSLADIYHAMYQSFINYDEEYNFYAGLLNKYNCSSLLEIGCGSGHLAKKFTENNFEYTGADMSNEMLNIARKLSPTAKLLQADMRNFTAEKLYDCIAITGRTVSYLTTNEDVLNTLQSLHKALPQNGKLIFDFIDAQSFFSKIDSDTVIEQDAAYENIRYKRKSRYFKNLKTGFTWNWHSKYYTESEGKYNEIATDTATLRAFTIDEIKLFLLLCNYNIIEIITKQTYAFDTHVIVAGKT